jgi:hypothetical protein
MNSDNDSKHEPDDPENAMRMIELELMRQRAARQQAGTPYRGLRAVSLLFLVAVILGALFAFYYFFFSGGLEEVRARTVPSPAPTAAPISPNR